MSTETYLAPGLAAADPHDTSPLVVIDEFLPDPYSFQAAALNRPFEDITIGSATFHGIAVQSKSERLCWDVILTARGYPQLTTRHAMLRRSPEGQIEPSYVHQDRDMGTTSGILYLNLFPPPGDGTTFWRHKATGHVASSATSWEALVREWTEWRELDRWEPWTTIEGKFNRLILFPSSMFHSRAIFDNYGTGPAARLIQLLFCEGELPCVSPPASPSLQ